MLVISTLLLASCSKGPGPGGRATIKGRVYSTNYTYDNSSAKFLPADSGYIGATKVYISYGDEVGSADNVDTDYDGYYTFEYLRPGKYVVWVYSKPLVNNSLDQAIVAKVEITDKKGTQVVPDFKINTLKN